jgi:hypothetical protein
MLVTTYTHYIHLLSAMSPIAQCHNVANHPTGGLSRVILLLLFRRLLVLVALTLTCKWCVVVCAQCVSARVLPAPCPGPIHVTTHRSFPLMHSSASVVPGPRWAPHRLYMRTTAHRGSADLSWILQVMLQSHICLPSSDSPVTGHGRGMYAAIPCDLLTLRRDV